MYNFELINSAAYYGFHSGSSEAMPHTYFQNASNTGAGEAIVKNEEMSYSMDVHRRLFMAFGAMVLSGLLSLTSVVFEARMFGIVGAFTLAISFILFSSWMKLASDEKSSNTNR